MDVAAHYRGGPHARAHLRGARQRAHASTGACKSAARSACLSQQVLAAGVLALARHKVAMPRRRAVHEQHIRVRGNQRPLGGNVCAPPLVERAPEARLVRRAPHAEVAARGGDARVEQVGGAAAGERLLRLQQLRAWRPWVPLRASALCGVSPAGAAAAHARCASFKSHASSSNLSWFPGRTKPTCVCTERASGAVRRQR